MKIRNILISLSVILIFIASSSLYAGNLERSAWEDNTTSTGTYYAFRCDGENFGVLRNSSDGVMYVGKLGSCGEYFASAYSSVYIEAQKVCNCYSD